MENSTILFLNPSLADTSKYRENGDYLENEEIMEWLKNTEYRENRKETYFRENRRNKEYRENMGFRGNVEYWKINGMKGK